MFIAKLMHLLILVAIWYYSTIIKTLSILFVLAIFNYYYFFAFISISFVCTQRFLEAL